LGVLLGFVLVMGFGGVIIFLFISKSMVKWISGVCIIEEAVNIGVLNKSGTWFSYNDNRLGQGKENVRQYLVENPKLTDELEAKVRAAHIDGTAKKLLAEKEKLPKTAKGAAAVEEVA
jgi:recombination protein RecA